MKKLFLLVLVAISSWAVAAQSTPKKYPIHVHVYSSMGEMEPWNDDPVPVLRLGVIIDGKKYTLNALTSYNLTKVTLLAIGDYPARLVRNVHPTAYEFSQTYEFLFPDGKTRKFVVVGQSE